MNDEMRDKINSRLKKYREDVLSYPIDLKNILKRQNIFFQKELNINIDADSYLKSIVETYSLASKQTKFGEVLEDIVGYLPGMIKSNLDGIDLEYYTEDKIYLIQHKSGKNWGNDNVYQALVPKFEEASYLLKNKYPDKKIECLLLCFNGQQVYECHDTYKKVCGEAAFIILQQPSFYNEILDLLGSDELFHQKLNNKYIETIASVMTQFKILNIVTDGKINWKQFAIYTSGSKPSKSNEKLKLKMITVFDSWYNKIYN